MSTSEESIPESMAENLNGAAGEGAELIGISANASNEVIVDAIIIRHGC